jgi:coenzyme F420-reducing hydrogenase alpha subunit
VPVDFKVKAGRAVGYTEAPRGALFHDLELDVQGRVTSATILTPTAQNIANIEQDIRQLSLKLLAKDVEGEEFRKEIEKLVRAYDPCLSCSVH